MIGAVAFLTVALPATAALVGLPVGRRSRRLAGHCAVLFSLATVVVAVLEAVLEAAGQTAVRLPVLGTGDATLVDLGTGRLDLTIRADSLSGLVAVAVAVVAACVQVYSTAYLPAGTEREPTRYPAYAATVSLFTAAMMLVVHADDLVLLLIGWEVMGACSYLLVGHHSERASARRAAVKAFLVTRVGDLGVLLAVVLLLVGAGTTSITELLARASAGQLPAGTVTAAAFLLLAGVCGKSAQFPLHTWLPDAMEGPTPVSALIHAATMVAAGVFLVARLLPLFQAAPGALETAAVIACVTMFGAAVAAVGQDDLKRLLAWSTISQVAFMLAGVAMAGRDGVAAPGVYHLLSHAAFKALLFLVAGCVAQLAGSTKLSDLGGLLAERPWLAGAFGLGLASLAGLPPLSGFWSKEAVLSAAEHAASTGSWAGWLVLLVGLLTTLVTGVYCGRAWVLVATARQDPLPDNAVLGDHAIPAEHPAQPVLPRAMLWPLAVLAVPAGVLGLLAIDPSGALSGIRLSGPTAVTGALLALAGACWSLTAPRFGDRDVAATLSPALRRLLLDGYRLDAVQNALLVRPVRALARVVASGDTDVLDGYVRGTALLARVGGRPLRLLSAGLATGYVFWLVAGALLVGLLGVALA